MRKKWGAFIFVFAVVLNCIFCAGICHTNAPNLPCNFDEARHAELCQYVNFDVDGQLEKFVFFDGNAELNLLVFLDIVDDLEEETERQLGEFEGDFDDVLDSLGEREKAVFGNEDFLTKVGKIIAGEETFSFAQIMQIVGLLLLDNLSQIVPILALVCAISIVGSLLLNLRGKELNKPLGDIIHFACFAVIAVTILTLVFQLVKLTSSTLNSLKSQMEIAFPILLTLMVGLGANTSVGIYQPMVAILCGFVMQVFSKILLPIFSLRVIFSVIGNLTDTVKLTKITKFLDSAFKYIIGFIFTIFSGFLAVSGIVAGTFDSVSIRTTKFAIKSYVPILGGYLSDGFSLVLASSVLIKNAIGYSGLILLVLTIISPVLKIVLCKLGLMLVSGIIEPVADDRITNFVSSTAKSLSMLSSIILAFSFAYFISMGLIMCSANLF